MTPKNTRAVPQRKILSRIDPRRSQSERGVCAILLGDDPSELERGLQDKFAHANLIGGDAILAVAIPCHLVVKTTVHCRLSMGCRSQKRAIEEGETHMNSRIKEHPLSPLQKRLRNKWNRSIGKRVLQDLHSYSSSMIEHLTSPTDCDVSATVPDR